MLGALALARLPAAGWISDTVSFSEAIGNFPTLACPAFRLARHGFESIQHSADDGATWRTELSSYYPRVPGTTK
jgi:hypothetical protein